MEQKVSAIVIAKDAGKTIEKCLKSLSWCSEVVLIDNNSSDKTLLIARRLGAKVYSTKGSFAFLRNEGAKKATGDWLFYLDTDEEVSPSLRTEIELIVSKSQNRKSKIAAYAIPRKNILLGKEMLFGLWSPDYVVRLISKSALIAWEGELHEQPKIKGEIGKLKSKIVHRTHTDLTSMVEKSNRWTEIEAKLIFKSNHSEIKPWRFLSISLREFWARGIKGLGFFDGTEGIIEIFFQIFNKLMIYAKVWELQEAKRKKNV